MSDYKNLKVWQKSHKFVTKIYSVTSSFPREEQFGITSQLRRAAISIPSNIAEGSGRGSDAELFKELTEDVAEIGKMLTSFIKKLKANNYKLKARN